jgi:uncharacterized protein DUF6644
MGNFFEGLEHTSWVMTIASTGWLYAAISVTHYFTLFVLVGTIVLVDLRILGVAARGQSVTQVAETLFPWTWTALGLALLSGFLMFTTDGGDYYPDRVFRWKMAVILLALISTVIVQRNFRKWDQAPAISTAAKFVAIVSIVLWIGSILAGVEIAAISGLG